MPSQHRRKRRQWRGSATRSHSSVSKKRRATKASARRKKTSERVPPYLGRTTRCTLSCPAYVLYGLHGAICAACRHERAKFALSIPALSGGPWQLLLGVEDVKGRALADRRFLAHAAAGHLGHWTCARAARICAREASRDPSCAGARPADTEIYRTMPSYVAWSPSISVETRSASRGRSLPATDGCSGPCGRCRGGQAGARRRKAAGRTG